MAKWDLSKLPEGRKPLPDEWFRERAQMQERLDNLIAGAETVLEEWDRGDERAFREAIEEMRSDVAAAKGEKPTA
jgi:hypothetical protein